MSETEENKTKDEANAASGRRIENGSPLFILVIILVMIPGVRNFAAQILAGKSDASLFLIMIVMIMFAITIEAFHGFAPVFVFATRIARAVKHKPDWSAIGEHLLLAVLFFGVMIGALWGGTFARAMVFFLGVNYLAGGLVGYLHRSNFPHIDRLDLIVLAILAFCAGFNLFSRL